MTKESLRPIHEFLETCHFEERDRIVANNLSHALSTSGPHCIGRETGSSSHIIQAVQQLGKEAVGPIREEGSTLVILDICKVLHTAANLAVLHPTNCDDCGNETCTERIKPKS